ncbi:hypothetical protein GA830_10870 [Mesorhizobium sp. NBSH29]|uniref:DUF6456 domain-containing protein n=1 Tax=Mesorhizobium sp. NBSH29 TaxID=2654249 RepID=UPI001896A335|nr:DUF6456 domain-containing protein [Mesorhizobium sp. NBSH29]QPC87186.1 hypothetical protein GA830_10870 [Mesorhizobium sp. NBSH29]
MEPSTHKVVLRLLRFLSTGSAISHSAAVDSQILLDGGARGTIAVPRIAFDALISSGLVLRDKTGSIKLADAGVAWLKRQATSCDPFAGQHRDLAGVRIEMSDGAIATVTANLAESPLAKLLRHKMRNGSAFLSAEEFQAGERLRSDYTRGQIMPRLGAHWEASVSSGRRGGNGMADITDAALASRQRVDLAIDAIGPELAGVLIDICCFLKGLEQVEMERGWPVRSAKVVLKTALGALARHYAPPPKSRRSSGFVHWGTTDYRPKLGSERL